MVQREGKEEEVVRRVEEAMVWVPARCHYCEGVGVARYTEEASGGIRQCVRCEGHGFLYYRRGDESRWYNAGEKMEEDLKRSQAADGWYEAP